MNNMRRVTAVPFFAVIVLSLVHLAASAPAKVEAPCDILVAAGNDCVAAHSTVRALYVGYTGPLYSVEKPGKPPINISVLDNGFADITSQDEFCSAGECVIKTIFDQSPQGNHLFQRIRYRRPACRLAPYALRVRFPE